MCWKLRVSGNQYKFHLFTCCACFSLSGLILSIFFFFLLSASTLFCCTLLPPGSGKKKVSAECVRAGILVIIEDALEREGPPEYLFVSGAGVKGGIVGGSFPPNLARHPYKTRTWKLARQCICVSLMPACADDVCWYKEIKTTEARTCFVFYWCQFVCTLCGEKSFRQLWYRHLVAFRSAQHTQYRKEDTFTSIYLFIFNLSILSH